MKADDLLAVARISRTLPDGWYGAKAGGDALYDIIPPIGAYLFIPEQKPVSSGDLIRPATEGLSNISGRFIGAEISGIKSKKDSMDVRIRLNFGPEIEGVDPIGCWICILREQLNSSGSLYLFQLREFTVHEHERDPAVAKIVDLFETGANPVLVAEMDDGTEVLVPFDEEFVITNRALKKIIIARFRDFIP